MTLYNDFGVERCGNKDVYFLFDAILADRICGNIWTLDGLGYVCRTVDGQLQRLHTFVIEESTGKRIPDGMYVDHINKCKTDNRLCNLRVVCPEDSSKNMPVRSDNTSGITGVALASKGVGYRAYITVKGKRIGLGTYPTVEEAARARYAAEERYGFQHQQNLTAFLIEMEAKP